MSPVRFWVSPPPHGKQRPVAELQRKLQQAHPHISMCNAMFLHNESNLLLLLADSIAWQILKNTMVLINGRDLLQLFLQAQKAKMKLIEFWAFGNAAPRIRSEAGAQLTRLY